MASPEEPGLSRPDRQRRVIVGDLRTVIGVLGRSDGEGGEVNGMGAVRKFTSTRCKGRRLR